MGCGCVDVEIGSYGNQVVLPRPAHFGPVDPECPKHAFGIDVCLADEIQHLWSLGIITTGCCCGHNSKRARPYIGVEERFIPQMRALGYEVRRNPHCPDREDSFCPKSLA